jgi:hypothetical protein
MPPHLIGIDPDYRMRVSDRLLKIYDSRFLEFGRAGNQIAATECGSP